MKIYLDLIMLINLFYDFLILSSVSVVLKRHASLKRIIFGVLIGSITFITLFIKFNNILLLLFKLVVSILMVLVTFGRRRFFENLFYLYIVTIIIGGSQYLLTGNNYEVNIVAFMIISPIIIYFYIRSMKEYKLSISKYYDVIIISGTNTYKLVGYMDTGNTLREPILKKPIIMVSEKLDLKFNNIFLVPYKVVNNSSILKCGSVDKVIIDNKIVDCLIGVVDNNVFNRGVDVILNEYIREILYD